MGVKDYFVSHILMHLLDLIRQEMGETLANLGFAGISWDIPQKQSQLGGAVPDIYIIYIICATIIIGTNTSQVYGDNHQWISPCFTANKKAPPNSLRKFSHWTPIISNPSGVERCRVGTWPCPWRWSSWRLSWWPMKRDPSGGYLASREMEADRGLLVELWPISNADSGHKGKATCNLVIQECRMVWVTVQHCLSHTRWLARPKRHISRQLSHLEIPNISKHIPERQLSSCQAC